MRTLPTLCFLRRFYQSATLALAVSTTFSQVDGSTNLYGFIIASLPPGFSLISDPLFAQDDNRIATLFGNLASGLPPNGFSIYFMENGSYLKATFNTASRQFEPEEVANRGLRPGEGVWVYNPGSTLLTVTFVGRVLHGAVTNQSPAGFSIASSAVPRSGTPDELSFPKEPGDIIYFYDAVRQRFQISVFDDLENVWLPPLKKLATGEAFLVYKRASTEWVQRHSVSGFAGQLVTARIGDSSDEAFAWSEAFAPHPMRAGNTVSLSIEVIPGGESLEIAAIAPSGETFFALELRDGLINNVAPYRTNTWNRLEVRADLDSQMFDLHLDGLGLAAGSFPLGPAASLLVPTISELSLRMAGFPGVPATAWVDNITLSLNAGSFINLVGIDFEQTQPRRTPETGTIRKESRP